MSKRGKLEHLSSHPSEPKQDFSVTYALEQAVSLGKELPPGDLVQLNRIEWKDRHFLLDQAARFGPVFKALEWNKFTVCIVGLKACVQFLQDHDDDLTPITMELEALFSKGFLRQMGGDDHRHYREALVRAISSTTATMDGGILELMIAQELNHYFVKQEQSSNLRDEFIKTLRTISSGMLIQLVSGATYGSTPFKRLLEGFQQLGPEGLVWNIGNEQKEAYAHIREQLAERISEPNKEANERLPSSIISLLNVYGVLDETFIGNLIYMIEMGRFDMYSLFRWITKFAAENPGLVEPLARGGGETAQHEKTLAEAFVLETLRLEQIERLGRRVNRNIIFGKYLIPKHAQVRLCLWESHKSPKIFHEPFVFNPERFTDKSYTSDQFAPFGLGKHRCPMANFVITMCTLFLNTLVKHYSLKPIDDGPPIRGVYHWEPAWKFAPRLKMRAGKETYE